MSSGRVRLNPPRCDLARPVLTLSTITAVFIFYTPKLVTSYSKRSSSLLKDLYQFGIKSIFSSLAFEKI